MYETISTDVLIIGGGGAGCRAAIEAHDLGTDVTMVVKGKFGNSGCTLNVGTSAVVGLSGQNGDTNMSSLCDLVSFGGFLGNQSLAKILVDETMERVQELVSWGVDYQREDDGSIALYRSAAHTHTRNFTFKPVNPREHSYGSPPGIAMMDAFMDQVEKRGIKVMDDSVLIDLLTNDGRVVGATVLDSRSNKILVVEAKSTILATGTYSHIFAPTTVSPFETGDGQAAAYRVGAELTGMEASQFVATSIGFPPGTRFLNSNNEEFLPKYGIDDPRKFAKEPLTYAVSKEIKEGRGFKGDKIKLDMSAVFESENLPSWFMDMVQEQTEKRGIDLRTEPIYSEPRSHTTMGGVAINERCETTAPGLYAAGAVAGGVYGHARPEGYTSMITVVFGQRAGRYAAEAAKTAGDPSVDSGVAQASIKGATSAIDESATVKPSDIKRKIKATTRRHAWVIKDEEGLTKGLARIQEIYGEVGKLRARNGYDWARALEVRNLLLTAELHFTGALERKESRGAFFRDDYPNPDNVNWLKNMIYKQVDGKLVIDYRTPDLKYCDPETHGGHPQYLPTANYGAPEFA
jgi:fumarate reductase (CoM/CoB) subunit A